MKSGIFLTMLGGMMLSLSVSASGDELPDHKLSEWSVGKTMVGEEVDLKKLDGKVVVIEYWGTR